MVSSWLPFIVFVLLAPSISGVFPREEYTRRLQRTQKLMKKEGIQALLLTMEAHHAYFTCADSEFWRSPTRPFFLVVPAEGLITAVVPTISGNLYDACNTVGNVVAWVAPQPDDEGISLLVDTLEKLMPARNLGELPIVGAELGAEMALRMPVTDFLRLKELTKTRLKIQDASLLLKRLRLFKSESEVALLKEACKSQSDAMDNIPRKLSVGMTEKEAARIARIELIKAGADRVPYIACRSGPGGYTDIVGVGTSRQLREGDVLIIDTGSMMDGYHCDFNRNWYFGWEVPKEVAAIQEAVYSALEAGIQAAYPGNTTADIFNAMDAVLPGPGGTVGRMGHSVGLALTEWPSILPAEHRGAGGGEILEEGMVFAIEPALGFGDRGQFLVHEEVIVIRPTGAELLSKRGPRSMPLITRGLRERIKEL